MDKYERYVQENVLVRENILKHIDDYSIYSYYIGEELEIGVKYSSPLRDGDVDPSFALYFSKKYEDTIMFKDHALGVYGSVFKFVMLIYNITYTQALSIINRDFSLGLNGEEPPNEVNRVVMKKKRPKREDIKIEITSQEYTEEFLDFFSSFGIGLEVIKYYQAKCVKAIHFVKTSGTSIVFVKELTIAYLTHVYYKIYSPFADRYFKFRNDLPYGYVEGAFQLKYEKDYVIITKSTKECMFFRQHWDDDAVAATSESVIISEYFIENVLKPNYKTIFIWLDNDAAGIRSTQKYIEKYPFIVPIYASEMAYKDPTDNYLYSENKVLTLEVLHSYIHKYYAETQEHSCRSSLRE